jgi:hypothetical protein
MSFTNSAIKGSKVTLPSVEGGFGTLNILRDPPKSIHTTYKPKVSDTSKITEMIDASGDRVCESIKKFARGVNPMVSVSYSNYGTNGGQMRDIMGSSSNRGLSIGQAYLPHRVVREGAFRPPIIPPEQLLPLSRMPRLPTSAYTNAGSDITLDFKTQAQCATNLKALREELLQTVAPSRTIFNYEKPVSNPSELKSTIQNTPMYIQADTNKSKNTVYQLSKNYSIDSGIKDLLNGNLSVNNSCNIQSVPNTVPAPERGIKEDFLYTPVVSNISRNIQTNTNTVPAPDRGVKNELLYTPVVSNISRNIQTNTNTVPAPERGVKDELRYTPVVSNKCLNIQKNENTVLNPNRQIKSAILCSVTSQTSQDNKGTPIEQCIGLQGVSTQDRLKGDLSTNINKGQKQTYIHEEQVFKRNRPTTSMEFNKVLSGVDINDRINSRQYLHLPKRTQRGAFENLGYQPSVGR